MVDMKKVKKQVDEGGLVISSKKALEEMVEEEVPKDKDNIIKIMVYLQDIKQSNDAILAADKAILEVLKPQVKENKLW